MEIYKKQSLSETFKVYYDKRMIKILLLGAISGFPWVIIGSSLSLWLKEDGLSRSTIGWAGLIFAVYAFNYLWAPIIDRIRIPLLTKKVGHRRGWIITMQTIILISLVCWSLINPTANLALVISIGLIIAIASATQDLTVDALRTEQIGENEGQCGTLGAAMMASEAKVKHLVLTHMGPNINKESVQRKSLKEMKKIFSGKITFSNELDEFFLN